MARDAKLCFKFDSTVTGTKPLPTSQQTVNGVYNANTSQTSLWMNFGGFTNTIADAGAFGAQADAAAPGTPIVPQLHSGSRDQMYARIAYCVTEAYATTTALKFSVEGTADATVASPVTYTVGQTAATGAVMGPIYSSTVASSSGNVMTVAAGSGLASTFSTTVPTITLTTALTYPIPVGSVVQVAGTTVPTGFTASTNYFVVSSTTTTVQLASTAGGVPIQATAGGSAPTIVLQSHNFAVGDLVQMTTVGTMSLNSQTPTVGSVYQVLSVPAYNTFTIGLGPGALLAGVGAASTVLTLSVTGTTTVFTKVASGRIASVPLMSNFAGSLRLNIIGAGSSAAGKLIIQSASIAYGRDSAAIG
jgi:hypothetical protein